MYEFSTGSVSQLVTNASDPIWSPDDQYVLFLRDSNLWASDLNGNVEQILNDGISRTVNTWISASMGINEPEFTNLIQTPLNGNYPNPFNPTTTNIVFSIPSYSKVDVSIYNVKGQKVKTILNESLQKGKHEALWNGNDHSGKAVSSGVYFYKLSVNGESKAMKKCILLK